MKEQFGLDLPAATPAGGDALFDSKAIRADALGIIAEAKSANADGPWDAAQLRYRRIMFPHLVSWIPDEDERRQLCFEFEREAHRLESLLAA